MQILIAVDSFKGSLSSLEAGEILREGICSTGLNASFEVISVADGGEGSLQMIRKGKETYDFGALDPLGRKINAYFLGAGDTAFLEMALVSGLTLLNDKERNPLLTGSYGVGYGILEAKKRNFKKIVVFVGGSATNDAGIGALSVLGFKFWCGQELLANPSGGDLSKISHFSCPELSDFPEIIVATDVSNPFYGESGATMIYGPQKGADQEMLGILEKGFRNIAAFFPDKEINSVKGAGAAGGIAGGLHLFLNAQICSATGILFRETKLESKVRKADFVITGEGRVDRQSLNGKLISRLMDLSDENKFILVAGDIEEGVFSDKIIYSTALKQKDMKVDYAMENAVKLMKEKGREVGEFLKNKFI